MHGALRGLLLCLLVGGTSACTDEMSSMRLYDPATGSFDIRLQLDWNTIGGASKRSERLLLADDGQARRNKGGNLYTRAPMTPEEHAELARLRQAHGRIHVERHTPPTVEHPSAHRLRFDGRGSKGGEEEVRAFAERVLARLAPEALVKEADVIVEAVVEAQSRDGVTTLRVVRVHPIRREDIPEPGARLRLRLAEPREGVGGVPTVFALSAPRSDGELWSAEAAAYIKVGFDKAIGFAHR